MDTYIMRVRHQDRLTGRQWGYAVEAGDWSKMSEPLRTGCMVDAKLKMGERLAAEKQIVLSPRDYKAMSIEVWRYADSDLDHDPERVA